MSAAEALRVARAAGIKVQLEGDDLVLEAQAQPPTDILKHLERHKPGIVALLRPARDGWSSDDWRAYFDERAGIAEFDSGSLRHDAEDLAFTCCVVEWLDRNPVRSSGGQCAGCGQAQQQHDPLVPFGTEGRGYTWLHSRCWPAWHETRKAEAIAALATMGIQLLRAHR